MTTLQERREWMESGCPVEPEPTIRQPMKFTLAVNPRLHHLVVSCLECGRQRLWGGMEVRPQGLVGTVSGLRGVVQAARRWMIGHARGHGMSLFDARAAYLLDHERVWAWTREMILEWKSARHGWVGYPGNPDHGFYLFEEPDMRREQK